MDFVRHGQISKTKSWEFQISTEIGSGSFFNLVFAWTRKCDHAGLNFTFEILSFYMHFLIHDNRHWDNEKEDYEARS